MSKPTAILLQPGPEPMPEAFRLWLESHGVPWSVVKTADELMSRALRGRPRIVMIDARTDVGTSLEACTRIKADSYTGIVPSIVFSREDDASFAAAFDAGADEVLRGQSPQRESQQRIDAMLRKSDRDTVVHPSTRLPGSHEIESEIARRMTQGDPFAVCYADLDHFKEYNDRYSYHDGDRVIRVVAQILHDVVKGLCGEGGFIGHIGGDDFIFIIPADTVGASCGEIVSVFDILVPFQYSEQDRRAGYFFGKDRRGQLHRVPLMTISIGVVTNERRHFLNAAQISELATEMKSYAKTLEGSVYTVDRRQDSVLEPSEAIARRSGAFDVPGREEYE